MSEYTDPRIMGLIHDSSRLASIFHEAVNLFDSSLTTMNMHNGTTPIEYWRSMSHNFNPDDLTREEAINLLREIAEFNSSLLVYIGTLMPNLSALSSVVSAIASQLGEDDELLSNRFYEHDCSIRELIVHMEKLSSDVDATLRQPKSYAIITGGKNHESNISGRNQSDSNTDGKSSQDSQKGSA